jgi:hypothetical protein
MKEDFRGLAAMDKRVEFATLSIIEYLEHILLEVILAKVRLLL